MYYNEIKPVLANTWDLDLATTEVARATIEPYVRVPVLAASDRISGYFSANATITASQWRGSALPLMAPDVDNPSQRFMYDLALTGSHWDYVDCGVLLGIGQHDSTKTPTTDAAGFQLSSFLPIGASVGRSMNCRTRIAISRNDLISDFEGLWVCAVQVAHGSSRDIRPTFLLSAEMLDVEPKFRNPLVSV